MNKKMKLFRAIIQVVSAATCAGIFWYARTLPLIVFYTSAGQDWKTLRRAIQWPQLGVSVVFASLALLCLWIGSTWIAGRIFRKEFTNLLIIDATTYLPLCFLLIAGFQGNGLLAKSCVLLVHIAGYVLLLLVGLTVVYLKIKSYQAAGITLPPLFQENDSGAAPTWKIKITVFVLSLLVYGLAGIRIMQDLPLGGDEPHYLLITHSLLHDHDLAIKNNYDRRDYATFFDADLQPHVSLGKDGTRLPGHPVGLSVLLLPAYALKGRQGAIWVMNLLAALLALQLYEIAYLSTRQRRLSLLLWGVVSFTSPLLLYSSQIYPEIPSALLMAVAYRMAADPRLYALLNERDAWQSVGWRVLTFGAAVALLPWMQQRMILPAILLTGYFLFRAGQTVWPTVRCPQALVALIVPAGCLALSGLLLAGFYFTLYGNPLPNAPYTSIGMNSVFSFDIFWKEGLLGLLLDQEGGLLMFAPYFALMFAGMLLMFRSQRLHTFWLLVVIGSVYLPCAGFILKWRGAWSPVARYMVALIPCFLPFLSVAVRQMRRPVFRYVFVFLVLLSFWWSGLFLQTPFLAIMRSRGINPVLEQYSTTLVDPTRYVPSFTGESSGTFLLAGLWSLVIAVFSLAFYRSAVKQPVIPDGMPLTSELSFTRSLKKVGYGFAALLGLVVLFTWAAEQTSSPIAPQIAKNKHLRDFLDHFNEYAQLSGELPLPPDTLQFEYLSKEKVGKIEDKQGPRHIVSGPFEPFPAGKYTAYFIMWVDNNSTNDVVATMDVVAGRGEQVFSKQPLRGIDFPAAGEYTRFALPFELPVNVATLETRVYFHKTANVRVQKIAIAPDVAEFSYRAGIEAFHNGRYDVARRLFTTAVTDANHLLARYHLGLIAQLSEDWKTSQDIFQQVVTAQPDWADAFYRLGLAAQQQQIETAQQHFERAVTLLPTHLDAWLALVALEKADERQIQVLYAPQFPAQVNFGNQVMFAGYSWEQIAPEKIRITYYWKALTPMDTNYTFFVHFKHVGIRFQQDHAPQRYDPQTGQMLPYPTSQWQVGEIVQEVFEVDAPKGTFEIQLGVWNPEQTGKRLSVVSTTGLGGFKKQAATLGRVTIK